jgi:hypothetical protein
MTGVRFTEQLTGWLSFSETDFNQALLAGRRDGTRARMRLTIEIDDLDRFVAGPRHAAGARGWVDFDELGGRLTTAGAEFELFGAEPDERHARMRYRLLLRDPAGRPLTLYGFKALEDDPNYDSWRDVTTLFTRVLAGHGEAGEVLATGILRLSARGFLRQLMTFRGTGGRLPARVAAVLRFQAFFLRGLWRAYRGAWLAGDSRPSFPLDRRAGRARAAGGWESVEGRPGLRRQVVPYEAGDGFPLTLHHLRGPGEPDRGPVLLSHGTGLRAEVFYGQPSGRTLVEDLLDAGYDVWAQNWRGSIDCPPSPYTLDRVARYDHPAAVAEVLRQTHAHSLKAIVHCQGSVSFAMAAVAGLVPEVTHVVSNSVSLHVRVPWPTRLKQLVLLPPAALVTPYLDAQWGIRSPALPSHGLALVARAVRRDCDNPVCRMASYMYGTGPDLLWRHANVAPDVHAWIGRELGFAPFRFIRQLVRSTGAGHLVRVEELPGLPASYVQGRPRTQARFTFLVGEDNRMFLPAGQRATFEHFDAQIPGRHEFHAVPGVGHLDSLVGRNAPERVFPLMLAGLER